MMTSSQTVHLGSHVHSLRVTPPLRHYTCSHISMVPRVYPSQTLYLGLHVHSLHGDPLPDHAPEITCPQFQGDPTSDTLHLGPQVHSPQVYPSQSLYLG